MSEIVVSVAKDFTRYPAGRLRKFGETSGEAFRQRFLEDPIRNGDTVVVELDGTMGYGSSFLEEAFGGLVRSLHVPAASVLNLLKLRSSDPSLIEEARSYIVDAGRAS